MKKSSKNYAVPKFFLLWRENKECIKYHSVKMKRHVCSLSGSSMILYTYFCLVYWSVSGTNKTHRFCPWAA